MRLYKQYVRPHLEFSTQAWSPWTEGDKACLEKVQQRAVRMVSGLKSDDYSERLSELGLTTLEERRHQADMAMVHKILCGRGSLDSNQWFERAADSVRATRSSANPLNLKVRQGRSIVIFHSFYFRAHILVLLPRIFVNSLISSHNGFYALF